MPVSGDLTSIDLADLLQNIEAHTRTGRLALHSDSGTAQLFFRAGKIAMMSRPERPALLDALLAGGHVSEQRIAAARRKQKGSQRSVVELLIGPRALTEQALKELADHRLGEDVADLIADAAGEFEFVECTEPGPDFDPDEASLGLQLAIAPLVLEATRRVDHWVEIRKHIPSDAMHFRVREGARANSECEDEATANAIRDALDGSRSVRELIVLFADRRFVAYKLLAELVRDRIARPVGGDDLLKLATGVARAEPERALDLVQRALATEPHHVGLLQARARFAEQLGDPAGATEAHKLLAHLHLEAGRSEQAQQALAEGLRLAPADTDLWERSLQQALAQGRQKDVLHDGMQLVELYRAPGLHARARAVLDRLLCVEPDAIDLHVEFARTCVDCGDAKTGVEHLARRGKALVGAANYVGARSLYAEILAIEPGHREATVSIEMIDKEEFAHRRERRRRLLRGCLLMAATAVVGTFVAFELQARVACMETRSLIGRDGLIEQRRYDEARELWHRVREQHPMSLTAWLEVPRELADLQARADGAPAPDAPSLPATPAGETAPSPAFPPTSNPPAEPLRTPPHRLRDGRGR